MPTGNRTVKPQQNLPSIAGRFAHAAILKKFR